MGGGHGPDDTVTADLRAVTILWLAARLASTDFLMREPATMTLTPPRSTAASTAGCTPPATNLSTPG